jgi:hypothetical protein
MKPPEKTHVHLNVNSEDMQVLINASKTLLEVLREALMEEHSMRRLPPRLSEALVLRPDEILTEIILDPADGWPG